jgi:hypothetical protein
MVWTTFWATFSQTHLVTLFHTNIDLLQRALLIGVRSTRKIKGQKSQKSAKK